MSMSIQTVPLDVNTKPKPLDIAPLTRSDVHELIHNAVRESTMDAAIKLAQATDRSSKYADEEIQRMLRVVEQKLSRFQEPVAQVLAVKVGDMPPVKDKSGYVSPYMGEMLLHAGSADSRRDLSRKKRLMFLNGPKGCGKTTLARKLAEYLKLPFYHMALSEDMTKTSLFSSYIPDIGTTDSPFVQAGEKGGVCLIDEVDNGSPNALVGLNGVDNGEVYNPTRGKCYPLHRDFILICAANTVGTGADMVYTARNRLDGAFLDRFWHIHIDYDKKLEKRLCPNKPIRDHLNKTRDKLSKIKAKEGISTRRFEFIYQACIIDGLEYKRCIDSMVMTWSKSVIEQSGVFNDLPVLDDPADTSKKDDRDDQAATLAADVAKAQAENDRLKKTG